jgi:hypothetical protein
MLAGAATGYSRARRHSRRVFVCHASASAWYALVSCSGI